MNAEPPNSQLYNFNGTFEGLFEVSSEIIQENYIKYVSYS
jgi:hypothetical protein